MFDPQALLEKRASLALAFQKLDESVVDCKESVDMVSNTLDVAAESVLSCAYEMTGVEHDMDEYVGADSFFALKPRGYARWASCVVALSESLVEALDYAVERFVKPGQASTMMAHNIETAGKTLIMAASFMMAGTFAKSGVDMHNHGKSVIEKMKSIDNGDFVLSLAPV